MAGVLEEGLATEQPPSSKEFSSVYGRWDVQYARFVVFPSSPHASHPSLVPHSATTRKARRGGKWISTSPYTSTAASLKLLTVRDGDLIDLILVVSIGSKTLEEHYISRLHYAWPQVSCVSGFPSRGTRSVFFSYKDGAGQIQKFGLRFLTIYEIEKFMTDLKESFEDVNSIPLLSYPPVASGISSQSEFIPTDEASHRVIKERSPSTSEGTYEIQASKSYGVSQDSSPRETRLQREVEEVLSSFPPSFTSFLKSCGPAIDEQAQPTTSQDLDLKAQIAKYMEDASFQDMLLKVEKVINEVGDFSILL